MNKRRTPQTEGDASDRSAESDWSRLRHLENSGSQPYSDRELIERRQIIETQIDAILEEAERIGLSPEALFQEKPQEAVDSPRPLTELADTGSVERMDDPPAPSAPPAAGKAPCCTAAQIAAALVAIKAAYTAAVAGLTSWKGCQDLAVIVSQAVGPLLAPCWVGKFIWRIKVAPFGWVFPIGGGNTFVHHAYAICPCTTEFGGSECLVLDPYTITGWSYFQTAEIYSLDEWVKKGSVWHATTLAEHDNGVIYGYTMKYYCRRAKLGPVQFATCRIVRDLLIDELRRYLAGGATDYPEEIFQKLLEQYGLKPDCCGP